MKRAIVLFAIVTLVLFSGPFAMSQSPPNYYDSYLNDVFSGFGGTGTSTDGLWNFSWSAPPVSYGWSSVDCGPPWSCDYKYWGVFSPGGSFTLTGPDGWIFTGEFYYGGHYYAEDYTWNYLDIWTEWVSMTVTGQWNNGLLQGAEMYQYQYNSNGNYEGDTTLYFGAPPTPEPASLLLVGTGLLSAVGFSRRKWFH